MTNPGLFNGDVSMTSAVGLPQVTKSVLACNPSLLAVTLDPTLGLRRRKGRRLSNGDFPREIPIGDVIKLLSILNPPIVYT